jgi:hypothetical protein
LDLSLSSLGDTPSDDVVAMLVEASFDPDICRSNYLTPRMDADQAREYCAVTRGAVLRVGDEPVGLAVARNPDAGEGVELPPGAVEIELWILARHRGQGTRWFALVTEWMAERFEVLVSVLWEGSGQVAALLSRSGWERLGSSFWSGPGGAGNCDVFCYYALGRHVSTQLG